MKSLTNKIKYIYDEYLIFFILLFGILTSFSYVFPILNVNNTEGYIYRGVLLGLICFLFVIGLFLYKKNPSKKLIISCSAYLVSGILSIFIAPLTKNVSIDGFHYFLAALQIVINILSIFIYIWLMKDYSFSKKSITISCLIMITFGLFLTIYSYIAQWQSIIDTFTKEYGWNYDVTSIFQDKTTYGFMLLMCSLFSIILTLNTKKYWLYILPIFFLANMFISRNKTSILCLCFLLLCLLIYHLVHSFKKYKVIWIVCLSTAFGIILLFSLLTAFKVGPFDKFNYYITQVIFNDASVVMQDRLSRWSNVFKSTDNAFLNIFGAGERISSAVLAVPTGDSVYINTYATGGIIKCLLYILLIVLVMQYNIKNTNGGWNKFLVISFELVLLIGGFFEDDLLFGFSHTALLGGLFFYCAPKLLEISNN